MAMTAPWGRLAARSICWRSASHEEKKQKADTEINAEIERLAALDLVTYEGARAEAAKRLNMRAQVLDRFIDKKRRALGLTTGENDKGQGRAVKIVDPLPWHESVDGDFIATALRAGLQTYSVVSD